MSLILDALRKSEAERRRGALPALALELPPPPAQRRPPLFAAWLALPLLAGVAVAGWWIWRDDAPPPADPAPAAGAPSASAPAASAPAGSAPVPTPAAPPREVLPAPTPPAPEADQPLPLTGGAATGAPTAAAAAAPPPVSAPDEAAPKVAPAADPAAPRALADLPVDVRRALPPLKLTMHLWAADPAERFVILDGQRLGEGGRAGPAVVDTITPDGVVLAIDGDRILLPLP